MKLPFPRFTLMPGHLTVIGADRVRRDFRVRVGWDGGLRLREARKPKRSGKFLLVFDVELPLRRLFRLPIRHRLTRHLLLASAEGAFPFEAEEGLFALGERDGRSYLCALEQAEFEELTSDLGSSPTAVLVADSQKPDNLVAAVQAWLKDGPVRDMFGRRSPVRPATLVIAGQVLALGGLCWLAADAWMERDRAFQVRQQELMDRARAQAEPLLAKRRSLFRMVEADRALVELSQLPSARLATALGAVVGALPDGSRIERIRLDDRQLVISGWGADPVDWLDDTAEVSVKTSKYPKENKFEITTTLER